MHRPSLLFWPTAVGWFCDFCNLLLRFAACHCHFVESFEYFRMHFWSEFTEFLVNSRRTTKLTYETISCVYKHIFQCSQTNPEQIWSYANKHLELVHEMILNPSENFHQVAFTEWNAVAIHLLQTSLPSVLSPQDGISESSAGISIRELWLHIDC